MSEILRKLQQVQGTLHRSPSHAIRWMSALKLSMGRGARPAAQLKTPLLISFTSGILIFSLTFLFFSKPRKSQEIRPAPSTPLAPAPAETRMTSPVPAKSVDLDSSLVNAADELVKAGKIETAVARLERETGSNPFLTKALFTLAAIYQKHGKPEKATATLMRILQIDPRNPLAYNNLGMIQLRAKRLREATLFLEKACENAPETAEPWLNLGIAYEQGLRWKESIDAYEKYIELVSHPDEKLLSALQNRLIRLRSFEQSSDRRIASSPSREETGKAETK